MPSYEDEYCLLCPCDIKTYPFIDENCDRYRCSYEQYKDCEKVPDCPAYAQKTVKVENPEPLVLDFYTAFTEKEAAYADCYMAMSISRISFAVSTQLSAVLRGMNIEGIQFIPVTLLEDNEEKYSGFQYVHVYNFLPVLNAEKSRYQERNGVKASNNLLQIKFNTQKMKTIALENRLLFRFPLKRNYFIFHVSVVEKIMAVDPIGVQFIKISDIDMPNTAGVFV